MTIQDLAGQFYGFFEQKTRADGATEYWALKDDAPQDLRDLVYKAHGDMLPDDWKYEFIVEALSALSNCEDPDDAEVEADIYNAARLRWLASHLERAGYVDEAVKDWGYPQRDEFCVLEAIGLGQYAEKSEVLGIVRSELETILESDWPLTDEEDSEDEDSEDA